MTGKSLADSFLFSFVVVFYFTIVETLTVE